ncbi:MAG: phytanoyl-CoA dioxygenase family protein [bacterium]|nr:phytanoyl-CoA dioxygenase family protein [bacterium]MDE0239805.1 phytanoyl-CoA dioxygenase family protein [bacterium]MDE0417883.1 phytanoyl-CoA dioxygenase family protein [bacterium]
MREVTDQDRAVFEEDGVVLLSDAFDEAWVTYLRKAVDEAMANPGPHAMEYAREGRFFGDVELAHRLPAFMRFVRESPAAGYAGLIMGSEKVNYFDDHLLVKEPGTTKPSPWHQDQPYWAVSGRQVCSLWLPLDPVSRDIAVEFVKGSHHWQEFSPYHFEDGRLYEGVGLPRLPDIESHRERYDILRFAMEPGDALMFHGMIVHGAPGNTGHHRRRALSTRWTGDDARFHLRPGEISVPTVLPDLADGARLDCDRFPIVWTQASPGHGV